MAQAARALQSGMIFDPDDGEREPFGAYLTDDARPGRGAGGRRAARLVDLEHPQGRPRQPRCGCSASRRRPAS